MRYRVWRYRIWQLWQALRAEPLTAEAWTAVTTILTPAETALFTRFSANDQWHSVRVLHALQEDGHQEPSLLKAALLHDVGKTAVRLTWLDRSVVVLGGKLLPGKTAVWGQGEARGWRRPFVVKAQHPIWGAEMAAAAGSDSLTIRLIQRHQDTLLPIEANDETELLRALQWADDHN